MASARKKYKKSKHPEAFEPEALYGNFIGDVLAGTVKAVKLVEGLDNRGNLQLEYDDPNG